MPMADMALDVQWSTRDFLFTFAMWCVMMVGMMSASALPVLLLFAGMHPRNGSNTVHRNVLLFGSGYILIWVGFSALAAFAQWALHHANLLSPAMATVSPRLAGAILIAAGAYQLTPAKRACLTQCQSPLGFLMSRWRGGAWGALQMGSRHGMFCLGCCWVVMCLLFVVGVMNLVWVAVLSAFILIEKVTPMGVAIGRIAGVVMMVAGALFLLR